MASFYSMLGFLSVGSFPSNEPEAFDILTSLPVEMSLIILRLLPAKDLANVVCVSKTWMNICKGDKRSRQRIRRHIRQQRRARINAIIRDDMNGEAGRRPRSGSPMQNISNYEQVKQCRPVIFSAVNENGLKTIFKRYKKRVTLTRPSGCSKLQAEVKKVGRLRF